MSKKELRKELERSLIAAVNSILHTRDKDAAKKTGKTVAACAKSIAKKFLKSGKTGKTKKVKGVKASQPVKSKTAKAKRKK